MFYTVGFILLVDEIMFYGVLKHFMADAMGYVRFSGSHPPIIKYGIINEQECKP